MLSHPQAKQLGGQTSSALLVVPKIGPVLTLLLAAVPLVDVAAPGYCAERYENADYSPRAETCRLFCCWAECSRGCRRVRMPPNIAFTCSLLEVGVSIQDVSVLLGHRSVRIMEKQYSPWVKSRQDVLDQSLADVEVAEP